MEENKYAAVASEKEDYRLLQILEERANYEAEAILAVIAEIEKRNLHVPDLEQIKEETRQEYTLQQQATQEPLEAAPTSFTDKLKNFRTLFVPQKHYFVTPILINLNILIFAVLALAGMHILSPEIPGLIAVGANFGPYTLTGEWWRLFSSMFLHIGIIHLLLNMYALASIGGVLEPLVGRKQFAMAYLLCGLAGSLVSLSWDQFRVSAGASGAVFGMIGMFMTLVLLEREMTWQQKKGMVLNMLGVIAFNLLFGLKDGIDNAAHMGGLVLGIVYGGVLLLRSNRYITQQYSALGNAFTVLVVGAAFAVLYLQIPTASARHWATMEGFGKREQVAMAVLQDMDQTGSLVNGSRHLAGLEQGIAIWDELIAELMELEEMPEMGPQVAKEVEIMLNYTRLRKKSYEMLRDDISSNQPWMHPKQQQVLWAINTYVRELQDFREGKEPRKYDAEEMPGDLDLDELEKLDADAKPLFVVDGEVLDNMSPEEVEARTTSLLPDDIESVTVYKDADAVARYGEKGRNGVIVIVTKKE